MSTLEGERYDAVIIGAGMSGLAAGIRLALFNKRVLILERHNAPGGLNSYYSRSGLRFDVGLHAMTNFVRQGVKGTPLTKLFRQLRIPCEAFALCEQYGSRIHFPDVQLEFTNDFTHFESQIADKFPHEADNFRRLVVALKAFDETALDYQPCGAKDVIKKFIHDPILTDMLLLPLMYYGSANENDMDWAQFVIMFKSIYCEGFARPFEGVRCILRELTKKYKSLGGERKMGLGVKRIHTLNTHAKALELDNGSMITADHIFSSAGLVETLRLCDDQPPNTGGEHIGKLSYVETIHALDIQPSALGWKDTIVFFNTQKEFTYRCPQLPVDLHSGVICFPNNYHYVNDEPLEQGWLRITALANYNYWKSLAPDAYQDAKTEWFTQLTSTALNCLPPVSVDVLKSHTVDIDMFTPTTVERFTGHLGGAIYGSPQKNRNGKTHLDNLYLIGTDQGFLGIVGAMLSGISMANYHVLKND